MDKVVEKEEPKEEKTQKKKKQQEPPPCPRESIVIIKPKEQEFSEFSIRDIQITCKHQSNQEHGQTAERPKTVGGRRGQSRSFLQMLTNRFGCQLVSEYLMSKSLSNMKRLIKLEQRALCDCSKEPEAGWKAIPVSRYCAHVIEESEAAHVHSGPCSEGNSERERQCDDCTGKSQYGKPLALLSQFYEMKMMQKLAPAYQRSMQHQLPDRTEEGHRNFGLRSTRSQSVSNTRYFCRDPQTKLLKDNDHK